MTNGSHLDLFLHMGHVKKILNRIFNLKSASLNIKIHTPQQNSATRKRKMSVKQTVKKGYVDDGNLV